MNALFEFVRKNHQRILWWVLFVGLEWELGLFIRVSLDSHYFHPYIVVTSALGCFCLMNGWFYEKMAKFRRKWGATANALMWAYIVVSGVLFYYVNTG